MVFVRRTAVVVGTALALVALGPPAPAQPLDDRALADSLVRMQRDIRRLEQMIAAGDAAAPAGDPSRAFARLQVRVSSLEEDIRATTGRVEELGFRIRSLEQRLETALADLESRLDRLEAPAAEGPVAEATPAQRGSLRDVPQPQETARTEPATPSGQATRPLQEPQPRQTARAGEEPPRQAAPASPPAAVTLPEGSVQQQYAYAFQLLQRAQYEQAEAALQAFMVRHPEADLADNARYWLAETYYVRENYDQAAKAFAAAYQSNKDGPKAADSLLKLGMSLARLDRTEDACTTLAELKRAFPDAPNRITDKRQAEAQRLGCP